MKKSLFISATLVFALGGISYAAPGSVGNNYAKLQASCGQACQPKFRPSQLATGRPPLGKPAIRARSWTPPSSADPYKITLKGYPWHTNVKLSTQEPSKTISIPNDNSCTVMKRGLTLRKAAYGALQFKALPSATKNAPLKPVATTGDKLTDSTTVQQNASLAIHTPVVAHAEHQGRTIRHTYTNVKLARGQERHPHFQGWIKKENIFVSKPMVKEHGTLQGKSVVKVSALGALPMGATAVIKNERTGKFVTQKVNRYGSIGRYIQARQGDPISITLSHQGHRAIDNSGDYYTAKDVSYTTKFRAPVQGIDTKPVQMGRGLFHRASDLTNAINGQHQTAAPANSR